MKLSVMGVPVAWKSCGSGVGHGIGETVRVPLLYRLLLMIVIGIR